ncbi:type I restriction enzyme HsdR N-terminal domain-containing protein [Mucilaginibacter mali]|uniref:Type I restriction enzyme HsdR N-terminal domain-containing protein n=1 Tax=Mucilaginibacter mali TaxID=2740462 RepID=A0A7D4Q6J7_9SPHI|nr:type I restriction enzyme HsdR N-terminal domain-containing protein [Mucilaginibacter mali]QKJ28665.1 type I restriction enzyme HsdR N-terminal domain-containing protein [Mucilaginibacter mali]
MDVLQPLNLPPYPFKITEHDGQYTLFDELRKKSIIITPEEWVRQHFVQYLIGYKSYPKTLIGLEGGLKLHGMARRTDILVRNARGEKVLLVECKAPSVNITQAVFDQIARYNMVHKVPLLAVTNGLQHYYCRIDFVNERYAFIQELPFFELKDER